MRSSLLLIACTLLAVPSFLMGEPHGNFDSSTTATRSVAPLKAKPFSKIEMFWQKDKDSKPISSIDNPEAFSNANGDPVELAELLVRIQRGENGLCALDVPGHSGLTEYIRDFLLGVPKAYSLEFYPAFLKNEMNGYEAKLVIKDRTGNELGSYQYRDTSATDSICEQIIKPLRQFEQDLDRIENNKRINEELLEKQRRNKARLRQLLKELQQ